MKKREICRFYLSGTCNKGASCNYYHGSELGLNTEERDMPRGKIEVSVYSAWKIFQVSQVQ